MDIITKLQEMGAEIVTSKMFSDREINQVLKKLQKDIFWSLAKKLSALPITCWMTPVLTALFFLFPLPAG